MLSYIVEVRQNVERGRTYGHAVEFLSPRIAIEQRLFVSSEPISAIGRNFGLPWEIRDDGLWIMRW